MINRIIAIIKKSLLLTIDVYQLFLSPIIKQTLGTTQICRYSPTCSTFAKNAIEKQGIRRGGNIALRRLLTCHPFARKETRVSL